MGWMMLHPPIGGTDFGRSRASAWDVGILPGVQLPSLLLPKQALYVPMF